MRHKIKYGTPEFIYRQQNLTIDRDGWIRSLSRLDPHAFIDKKITFAWLYDQHNKQMEFNSKIQSKLNELDMNDQSEHMNHLILNYAQFLEMCAGHKKDIIVPTLLEDFVWHSHMIDHETYVEDMKKIFGKILGHRNDIDVEQYEKRSNDIRKSYYNSLPNKNNQQSSCGGVYSSCGTFINCGTIPRYNNYHLDTKLSSCGNIISSTDISSCSSSSCSSSSCSSCGGGGD
jgi:hypothetical protein